MKQLLLFLLVCLLTAPAQLAMAQGSVPDTAKNIHKQDTLSHPKVAANPLDKLEGSVSGKLNMLNPAAKIDQLKSNAANTEKQLGSAIKKSLPVPKKNNVSVKLSLGSDSYYQPAPSLLNPLESQQFASAFTVAGSINAYSIPFNINYSSNRNLTNTSILNNSLFKFDFNSRQFVDQFKSDMQQYEDLRKTAFGGLSITDYARKVATAEINSKEQGLTSTSQSRILAQYLNNPQKLNELLSLNEGQMKQKLLAEVKSKENAETAALNNDAKKLTNTGTSSVNVLSEKDIQQTILKDLSGNTAMEKYLNNPSNLNEMKYMNVGQIEKKLNTLNHAAPNSNKPLKNQLMNSEMGVANFIIILINISNAVQHENEQKKIMHKLALSAFLSSHQGVVPQLSQMVGQQQKLLSANGTTGGINPVSGINPGKPPTQANPEKEVDQVVSSISNLKNQLQKGGYDVHKMLEMQQMLDAGKGNIGTSELASAFMNKRPANLVQDAFTNVQALKIGSFGGKVPGGTEGQDEFISGTSVTYKALSVPVTFGFGSTNDIGSLKDAGFQGSSYSAPKNITFLGAQVNRGVFGKIKISFASSVNRELANSSYSLATVSANSMAVTLSKEINIHGVGDFIFDASKSASLTNSNYQSGSQAILDVKAGLNNDLASNLFEAVSFGASHRLDIKELDMSDNVYFNYSGMGYQNPANNGYGGGRLKVGGNIKKSFYKRKLTLTLRTDINNMPISYTSNDKWKNYQVQLDSRYTISKKVNISFKYTNNNTQKKVDDVTIPVYSFQKIQFDGSSTFKIGKYFTAAHLTVGEQFFSDSYVSQGVGNMLMMNYTQSVVIDKNTLTASIFYNKEMSAVQLIGNMLNSDVAYQYVIFKKISLSSGLTYLDNAGIAQQVGIRQGFQLLNSGHFSVDSYVDIRKNLITPVYAELYAQVRAELSLKYNIKL